MKISGTIQALSEQYTVGGLLLDQPMLSALTRFGQAAGFARVVGMREKASNTKGKNAKIWEIEFPDSWDIRRNFRGMVPVKDW